MPNPYFKFKEFTVYHDKCAMKVGTDGVLLGAWSDIYNAKSILDVGCGTGLISLMSAQRNPTAKIVGIDIDHVAVEQAKENIESSPWNDRISILHADYNTFESETKFDCIVSNPPYFKDALKGPNCIRNMARHNDSLYYDNLISKSVSLLSDNGLLSVVIPTQYMEEVIFIASNNKMFLSRQTLVITKPGAESKRVLLEFSMNRKDVKQEELLVELSRHVYSEDYINLTKDFYLKM